MTESRKILVASRFCGPPTSGNGGYSSGLVAQLVPSPAECTLRKPIPIERELRAETRVDGGAVLLDGEEVVIDAAALIGDFEVPRSFPLEYASKIDSREMSPAFHNHPFPTCFTCGPERNEGDGLRIFPSPIRSSTSEFWVSLWTPSAEFADASNSVRPEIVWAALDCPTGFAAGFPYEGTLVTGRLGVAIDKPVIAGEQHVIVSRKSGAEGRKHHAVAALYGPSGELRARARATWIKLN
jgi:hypothetical protein